MKVLKAPRIKDNTPDEVERLHEILDGQERHLLEFLLWQNGGDEPTVSFSIAHNNHSVLLGFFVDEKEIRATITKTNGPVWEDSCVEFFVAFDERGYYNFEFNYMGTVHCGFGKNVNQRELIPGQLLSKIRSHTAVAKIKDHFHWEMAMEIPVEVFNHHPLSSLAGITCRGNFCKCGDGLSEPHYLAWNNIESATPNFHLPQFFGKIMFA